VEHWDSYDSQEVYELHRSTFHSNYIGKEAPLLLHNTHTLAYSSLISVAFLAISKFWFSSNLEFFHVNFFPDFLIFPNRTPVLGKMTSLSKPIMYQRSLWLWNAVVAIPRGISPVVSEITPAIFLIAVFPVHNLFNVNKLMNYVKVYVCKISGSEVVQANQEAPITVTFI